MNCSHALDNFMALGASKEVSCFIDLRPTYNFGDWQGDNRQDHDGSLSWVCPVMCGICPYPEPIINTTISDTHNLTTCRELNNSCAKQWRWPRNQTSGPRK